MKKKVVLSLILTVVITITAFFMNYFKTPVRYYAFPAVLIFLPLILDRTFSPANLLKPSIKGFRLFFSVSIAVVLIYPVLFFFYWINLKHYQFAIPDTSEIFKAVTKGIAAVAVAAIPEEFFFRGYVQEHAFSQFNKKFFKIITLKNLFTSLLFGAVHAIAFLDITRASTFFPSLLFGLFTEKSEGRIFYSISFHVISNILAFVLWTFIN
ncbi:MAG TPA: CPBP family intramembrane metalloprotease [bacterium]|nr:CPBP family intramembrane metalloprotease [bacterium]HPS30454.1 CPBP family intramembrane metalloprotease [bacterium]